MSSQRAVFDTYRTIANGAISASFAAIGTPFTHLIRVFCITNNTDGDMIISTDGINNKIFMAKNSYKIYDISSNQEFNSPFYLPANTQFYVKQSTSPSTGDIYVEAIYGQGE